MFLSNTDYQVMIGERAFDLIQQSDEENRRRAEEMAQEEMAGYLRPRYDVGRIFARRGTERNMQIVMFLCDITLYHLVSWLPQKMGYEIREIRYRRAIEWLQGVQSGKNPCLRGGGVPYDSSNGGVTLLANLALLLPFSCLDTRKGAKESQGYGRSG